MRPSDPMSRRYGMRSTGSDERGRPFRMARPRVCGGRASRPRCGRSIHSRQIVMSPLIDRGAKKEPDQPESLRPAQDSYERPEKGQSYRASNQGWLDEVVSHEHDHCPPAKKKK